MLHQEELEVSLKRALDPSFRQQVVERAKDYLPDPKSACRKILDHIYVEHLASMKQLENVKVGIFGDGDWAANLVQLLDEHPNFQVCFVVKRYKTGNERLETCAKDFEIRF